MTREEVINILSDLAGYEKTMDLIKNHSVSVQDALLMAIKSLEQEPMRDFTEEEAEAYSKALDKIYKPIGINVFDESSGDLISRQAVLDIDFHRIMHTTAKPSEMIRQEIINLPSIKQEPKTGHWEWVQYDYNPKFGNWHCSECRCVVVECVGKEEKGGIPLYKYCPQCGAKMVEPQERSDKE